MNAEPPRRPAVASAAARGLPIPADWAGRRSFTALGPVAFLVLLAVGLAVCGGLMAWSGDVGIGIFVVAVAVLLGCIVVLGLRGRSMRRRRGARAVLGADPTDTTKAVRFTYSAWTYVWVVALVVMVEVFLLALTVLWVSVGDLLTLATAIVFGGMALVIAWFLVTMLRLAPGEVTLSPAGVLHRSLTSTYFVPWCAVVGVSARWLGKPLLTVEAYPSEDTAVRRYMGRFDAEDLKYLPIMVIRTVWLPDPVLVFHTLCFYHAHSALRAELSTQDGVDRINNGRAACHESETTSPVQPG